MIEVAWDAHAIEQRDRLMAFSGDWEFFLEHTAHDLAEYAQTYFKPMLNVRNNPRGNGDTANSINYEVTKTGEGFDITYNGLLSAYYMDVGNFPAGTLMTAASKGLKFFPVDKRFGAAMLSGGIHGMGSFTPGVPTHWSEETARHMSDDDVAFEIMEKWMNVFLDEVVV